MGEGNSVRPLSKFILVLIRRGRRDGLYKQILKARQTWPYSSRKRNAKTSDGARILRKVVAFLENIIPDSPALGLNFTLSFHASVPAGTPTVSPYGILNSALESSAKRETPFSRSGGTSTLCSAPIARGHSTFPGESNALASSWGVVGTGPSPNPRSRRDKAGVSNQQ